MDHEVVPVILLVRHLVIPKGHVADDHIEEVIGKSGLFKAGNGDICLLVELFGDLSGDLVQLHAVQLALGKAVREHSEEIAHAHGRLQNVAACKAHPFQSCVHFPNDNRGGIVGV